MPQQAFGRHPPGPRWVGWVRPTARLAYSAGRIAVRSRAPARAKVSCWPHFRADANHDSGNMRGETTISRLADGTALRQTMATPKRRTACCELSQDGGSVCRQDSAHSSQLTAHSGARLQRLVHGALAARNGREARALISDVGWRAAAAKRVHDKLECDHQPHRRRARARHRGRGRGRHGHERQVVARPLVVAEARLVPPYHSPPERARTAKHRLVEYADWSLADDDP